MTDRVGGGESVALPVMNETATARTRDDAPSPDATAREVFTRFCLAGMWPGVGETIGRRVLDSGIAVPEQASADRLAALEGVGPKRAERLMGNLGNAMPVHDALAVLMPVQVPHRFAPSAVRELGAGAAELLRGDPWLLLSLPGIRPDQADYFARKLLGAEARSDDPRRGRALVRHLLRRAARDGHTAQPEDKIAAGLHGLSYPDSAAAIVAALEDDVRGYASPAGGTDRVLALARYADAEETIAGGLARLAGAAEPLADEEDALAAGDGLDDAQRAAVLAAVRHGVSVLTGGPGTGKSRTMAAVVALMTSQGLDVALAAPTGRAAKRLEELTEAPAGTLHRLLGAQGTTGTFSRGHDWPLEAELVVVDEASMLDAELAAALVAACMEGTHLLLVGDPAQLPSIGAGRVLADLIDSQTVPVTELRTLYRQRDGGDIAKLANAVRGGELPPVSSPEHEVVIVPARDGAEAAHRVVQLVTDSIPRALEIPPGEVQVVTPVHRGAAGTVALNKSLKAKLNPGPGAVAGFDIGDRVVATANHVDEGFANGEVGTVTGTGDDGGLLVTFTAGPVAVPKKFLGDLLHGWALTVHRAQGSEWPAVVTVLPGEAAGMLSRPLVYTALTRARRHLSVVHAAGPALARAVRTIGERPRLTRLSGLLRERATAVDIDDEPE